MAFDAFMKITGGPAGESTDTKHAGEIELATFELTAANTATVGSGTTGSGAGKVQIGGFKANKRVDSSSPILFQACCSGDHYKEATVTVRKAGGKNPLEYLVYTFTQVYVQNITTYGNAKSDDLALETVTFSFATVHQKYVPQKPDGSGGSPIEGGWDVTKNTPK